MNKRKHTQSNPSGFTIVEIILFFAVSTALMVGIIAGITTSIGRQRYNDTVNDFAEYLRSVYTEVQSVSNGKPTTTESGSSDAGRTNMAIYGKLLRITDGKQITSDTVSGYAVSQSFTRISSLSDTYPCSDGLDTPRLLGCVKAHPSNESANQSTYHLIWDGVAQTPAGGSFSGCILIIRSPVSGAVQTYFSSSGTCGTFATDPSDPDTYFNDYKNDSDINFCVQSDDNPNSRRRNVRIKANSANSSGVVIPELDNTDNACAL